MANMNANGTFISTYHLSNNPALYEPSRSNAFEFLCYDFSDLLVAGKTDDTSSSADYLSGTQEVIKLSVAEAFVPNFELDTIEIKRGNSTMKFAGTPSFQDGTIKCNDYVGARTKDHLLAWQALAYNVQADVVELAGKYKRDCVLVEYAPDYSKVIRKWTLKGCWVRGLSEGSFSHDSPDKRSIDVTIVYDRAIPELPQESAE